MGGETFSTDDPEGQAKLALTIVVICVSLCLLAAVFQVLCLAGETICCFISLLKCIRRCCRCFNCKSKNDKNGGDGNKTTPDGNGNKDIEIHDDKDANEEKACCAACCCVSATAALATNSASSRTEPRRNAGEYASLFLMIIAIMLAIIWGFYFGEEMHKSPAYEKQWNQYCHETSTEFPQCARFQAAYRVSFVAFIFFIAMAFITLRKPSEHYEAWDAKIFTFLCLLVASSFAPNGMFLVWVWIARIAAFLFLVLQQIILIDTAYSLNEYLVGKGYAEQEVNNGSGLNRYLVSLVALSIIIFAATITGLSLLFAYFDGCTTADAFNSITLVFVVSFTLCQLFVIHDDTTTGGATSQTNSLLTSAVVAGYVVYLTFVSVSSNPDKDCNPMYNDRENLVSVSIGLAITFITLCATVYFASISMTALIDDKSAILTTQIDLEKTLTGEPMNDESNTTMRPSLTRMLSDVPTQGKKSSVRTEAKFYVVMALISCYWCCVLTNWGNPGGGGSSSSPTAGHTAMWMNISAAWICSLLYIWTIIAPKLFPDRDFS